VKERGGSRRNRCIHLDLKASRGQRRPGLIDEANIKMVINKLEMYMGVRCT
jgi:hypothetical protein